MSAFIFASQCVLVFSVPSLFGWVVLRRIFREASWLALLPGSVLVGFAALMATMNEVRYFAEMGVAAWFSYKLLFGLTLLIALALPNRTKRPRFPGCVDRGWKLALLILGVAAVGIYYGIPAFGGYLDDAWWGHYPAAVQIQTAARFPLHHMFEVDSPLYYHPGPDILAACWSYLLDQPVQKAFALGIVILAPCAFLLAFALLARLARNYWAALLGASFLIAGGNLRFLLFFSGKFGGFVGALQVFNSHSVQSLLQLIFTPSHALGVPLVLTIALLFRHMTMRPSLLMATMLGLLLGSVTLVAEWYFLSLLGGLTFALLLVAWRRRSKASRDGKCGFALAMLPAAVGIFWGAFNKTYISGVIGGFWMRYDSVATIFRARQYAAGLVPDVVDPPRGLGLIPLQLNLAHLGSVPSWQSTASTGSSYIPIFGAEFFMEAMPVLLIGLPFGLWLAWRRRDPVVVLLAFLATVCVVPPIFLDWGYRSTDFLRFFTAAYSFAALFLGWAAGSLIARRAAHQRVLGVCLAISCLISPIGLGIVGLMPHAIEKVTKIASTAQSLQSTEVGGAAAADAEIRSKAFEKLAISVGDFLFPLTQGRDRVIVIVPPDQVPKVEYFPEWLEMTTLSRVLIPVGAHWTDSLYSAYYRSAVTSLDARSVATLGAKWIIVSNVFQEKLPPAVELSLADRSRFAQVGAFREGRYAMAVFRVLPPTN